MPRGLGSRFIVLLLMAGCGRDIAQTAWRDADATEKMETSCEQPITALPALPAWAGGTREDTPVTASSYGPGEGPGLFIASRDAHRVYLNGTLIHESKEARTVEFVPLSLLPGDNQLAIVVWASHGTPAALLQLDDLTESYWSDAGWRAELSPRSGFAQAGYDARDEPATDYGRLGSLPGCDPGPPFPQASQAHWIGPRPDSDSSAVLRRVIRIAPVGFGANAQGGYGTALKVVTTYDELEELATTPDTPALIVLPEGDYDFRRKGDQVTEREACPSACSEDPTKLRYRLMATGETCAAPPILMPMNERTLHIGSNKSIVGLGRGAHLRGVALDFGGHENIVVRNLAIYDVNPALQEGGDAIGMRGARDVWIDHLTSKWIGDGLTDISPGTEAVTLSWMHYDGVNAADCGGRHTHASTISDSSVTIHHSFYDHTDSHAPLVEGTEARVHVFDNLVQDDDGYGVGSTCSQVLLEGTTFRNVLSPTARRACGDNSPLGLISAPPGSNLYLQDVGAHTGADGQEPHDVVFEPTYLHEVDPAEQNWPQVFARAGVGGPWRRTLSIDP